MTLLATPTSIEIRTAGGDTKFTSEDKLVVPVHSISGTATITAASKFYLVPYYSLQNGDLFSVTTKILSYGGTDVNSLFAPVQSVYVPCTTAYAFAYVVYPGSSAERVLHLVGNVINSNLEFCAYSIVATGWGTAAGGADVTFAYTATTYNVPR
jgi:hypothetical protein